MIYFIDSIDKKATNMMIVMILDKLYPLSWSSYLGKKHHTQLTYYDFYNISWQTLIDYH